MLRLRIVPDDIVFDRFDPLASEEELELVERLWRSTEGDLDGDAGRAAWREFVGRTGGARAAWLARTFPMEQDADGLPTIERPQEVREEPYFGTPRGLPEQLEVWIGRGGNPIALVETLDLDLDAIRTHDLPSLSDGEARWWTSFAEAERVGLGARIDLGDTGDDLDVVLVTGLSEEPPNEWYLNHGARGQMSLVAPGVPTNTVEGAPAAPLDADPEHWLNVARGVGADAMGARTVAAALTGDPAAATPLLGGELDLETPARAVLGGVWLALWGHPGKDLMGLGAATHEAGLWAVDSLRPIGALPTLRVGTQPYGLLHVTALDRWQAHDAQGPFEEAAAEGLRSGRDYWSEVAEQAGNVVDVDTQRLLDLIAHSPSSGAYAWRSFLPLELALQFWWTLGAGASWVDLVEMYDVWWEDALDVFGDLEPQRRMTAFGWPVDLGIPLVVPDNMSETMFRQLLRNLADPELNIGRIFQDGGWEQLTDGVVPNSLLARLLVWAHWVAQAEVFRAGVPDPDPRPPRLAWQRPPGTRIEEDARAMKPAPGSEAWRLREILQQSCGMLADLPLEDVERAFRGLLDTAAYRLDPWFTGYALRRVREEGSGWPRMLGLYGWVDAPRPGSPGPNEGGLLHAPSHDQAYTAMVLRDRAISDVEPDRWVMDLDSAAVRGADRVATAVRAGLHISEALGAEVERMVGDLDEIDRLRAEFPIVEEHAGRRTCDGVAVLEGSVDALGLPAETRAALGELRAAVEAYGDLLVAGAAHMVVSGRGETAGTLMDAAAGLAQPPTLEVLQTPRTGRAASTTVLFGLPDSPDPPSDPEPSESPTRLAEPGFAAWLEEVTGAPDGPSWLWQTEVGETVVPVSLADLSLAPCDAAVLAHETLAILVGEEAGEGAVVSDASPAWSTHHRARSLVLVVGGEPAAGEHLVVDRIPDDEDVRADIRARIERVRATGDELLSVLQAAVMGSVPAQRSALHDAVRWGIRSIEGAELALVERVQGAIDGLEDRLQSVPADAILDGMSVADLGRVLAELATADGRWPVLSRLDLLDLSPGLVADARPDGAGTNPIDEEWLSVVSPVRERLARIEAVQLETLIESGSALLHVWTTRPGDIWQKNVPRDPDTGRCAASHVHVALGPSGAFEGVHYASPVRRVGLVDQWSETVPEIEHTTTAGFGFNAPAARAPQAVLIGAPPSAGGVLEDGDLAHIVLEARRLTRVRMGRSSDLDRVAPTVPISYLPASQPAGVDLEPAP
jgi:hypothetical protein